MIFLKASSVMLDIFELTKIHTVLYPTNEGHLLMTIQPLFFAVTLLLFGVTFSTLFCDFDHRRCLEAKPLKLLSGSTP
jgi:hypothetical protein